MDNNTSMLTETAGPGLIARLPGHLAAVIMCLGFLASCDRFAIKPFLILRIKQKKDLGSARWFFVHALANLLVCVTGMHALVTLFRDPHNAVDSRVYGDTTMFGSASSWPLTFVNAVHVYHMIGGFHLTSADYFHHLLFIPLLGFPGQVLLWGAVEPAGAFFISGLPGGISYLLLGLNKLGWVEPIVEKRVTANLNAWVRTPGIIILSFVVYQALIYNRHTLPLWAPALQCVTTKTRTRTGGAHKLSNELGRSHCPRALTHAWARVSPLQRLAPTLQCDLLLQAGHRKLHCALPHQPHLAG